MASDLVIGASVDFDSTDMTAADGCEYMIGMDRAVELMKFLRRALLSG